DGQPVPARGGPAVGRGTEDHEYEQERANQLGEERVPGVAGRVGEHAEAGVDAGLPEYAPDGQATGDAADELRHQVPGHLDPGHLPGGGEREGDGRVDVATGDV